MKWLLLIPMILTSALAQDATEIDARVEAVAESIRCVVCNNQSIAESDAPIAHDMVDLIRERIEAGDSDEEVRTYLSDRYGEFVLLKPKFSGRNFGLWAGPLFLLLAGGGIAYGFIRSKKTAPAEMPALTDEEREELARRLGE